MQQSPAGSAGQAPDPGHGLAPSYTGQETTDDCSACASGLWFTLAALTTTTGQTVIVEITDSSEVTGPLTVRDFASSTGVSTATLQSDSSWDGASAYQYIFTFTATGTSATISLNTSSGSSTTAASASAQAVVVQNFAGIDAHSAFATGAGSAPSASITTQETYELVLAILSVPSGTTVSAASSGFTTVGTVTDPLNTATYTEEGVFATAGSVTSDPTTAPSTPAHWGLYLLGLESDAAVTFNPSNGAVGSDVAISGTGFTPSADVTPYFGGLSYACHEGAVVVAADGSFGPCTITVPAKSGGTYSVAASTTDDGTVTALTTFTVDASWSFATSSGTLPQVLTLTGTGFAADEGSPTVVSVGGASQFTVGACSTNSYGDLTCSITVTHSPDTAQAFTVDAITTTSTFTATSSFTFTPGGG
ncbi:MAG: hypothetical protein ACREBZ_04760, partial [Thermoplasmata archaeon]